ncbi:MAG: glycosyltransferase family 2 protein [bacterium]|nr:glycosyltransferase family 2 protein [bacterium]
MSIPSISICTIFKNEEQFLPEFLDCFDHLADEWILTDTGSTDDSIDIITNKGINYLSFPWCDHFGKARNFGIAKAKSDWIFVVDVDDRIRYEHAKILKDVLQKTSAIAITINYVNLKKSNWIEDEPSELNRQVRMVCFRNGLNIHYRGAVHEDPMASIEEIDGEIIHLDIPIYHLGYMDHLLELKSVRNSKLLNKQWEDGRRDPDLVHHYTSLHWGPKKWIREALESAQDNISSFRSTRVVEDLYYWYLDFDSNSCTNIKQSLKIHRPDSAAFLLESARQNFMEHKSDIAFKLFKDLWMRPELFYPIRYRSEVALRLAFLYASQANLVDANQLIDSYLEKYSWTASLWHLKFKLLAALGSWNELQVLLNSEIPNLVVNLGEQKMNEIIEIMGRSPVQLDIPDKLKRLIEEKLNSI